VGSDGLNGIWLTLIWCRGAIKAKFSVPDMTGWLGCARLGLSHFDTWRGKLAHTEIYSIAYLLNYIGGIKKLRAFCTRTGTS
jgi:hypothetical protein